MIPTIETIVEDLIAGKITKSQAVTWLLQHADDAHGDLRDYFAGKALQGFISAMPHMGTLRSHTGEVNEESIAAQCFAFADAMLAERTEARRP